MRKDIQVRPELLDQSLSITLAKQLREQMVGSVTDTGAIVLLVFSIKMDEAVSNGRVNPLTGDVRFELNFLAVLFRAFVNEVLEAVVDNVMRHGFSAMAGPQRLFVSAEHIPPGYEYKQEVSEWTSTRDGAVIKKDEAVRLKVIHVNRSQSSENLIATIIGPRLGPTSM